MNKYHIYFMKSKYDINNQNYYSQRNKQKHSNSNLDTDYDVLFFNFLNLIRHHKLDVFYNSTIEQQIKLEIFENMNFLKDKTKTKISETMCYNKYIDLHVLDCLSQLYRMNIIYTHNNILYKMIHGAPECKVYVVNNKKEFLFVFQSIP